MNNIKQFLGGLLQRVEEAGAPSEHAATWQKLLELGDVIAAVPELQQAMRRDDAHAMNAFATLLMLGKGIERDKQGAASWFRQAAVRGHVSAQGSFGICLATGTGLEKNETEAAYWLYRAGSGAPPVF